MTQLRRAAPSSIGRSFAEALSHLLPAVMEMGEMERVMDRSFRSGLLPHQSDPGGARARIQLEENGLKNTLFLKAIPETDGEGEAAVEHRSPPREE